MITKLEKIREELGCTGPTDYYFLQELDILIEDQYLKTFDPPEPKIPMRPIGIRLDNRKIPA